MSALKSPCERNCIGRSWDCHSKCQAYASYVEQKNAIAEKRRMEQLIDLGDYRHKWQNTALKIERCRR